jgi:hypothetical protein
MSSTPVEEAVYGIPELARAFRPPTAATLPQMATATTKHRMRPTSVLQRELRAMKLCRARTLTSRRLTTTRIS